MVLFLLQSKLLSNLQQLRKLDNIYVHEKAKTII